MKRVVILWALIFCLFFIRFAFPFSGNGNGTQNNPYNISNCDQLNETRDNLTAYYILINNIDFSECDSSYTIGYGFVPIGNKTPGFEFSGNFDGNGYNISNLYINSVTTDYKGLFGYLANATIQDLGMINVSIFGASHLGGLTGDNHDGNITNSFSTGIVNGTGEEIGGLTGNNSGIINNSYSSAEVNGYRYVGGLTGNNSGGIINSHASGDVNCDRESGGLSGENQGGTINNSYATGNVFGNSYIVGGLVGYVNRNAIISNSYATGNVSGSGYSFGGLVGMLETGKISSSYATGNVSANNQVGGLAGSAAGTTSNQSYATGNVNGSTNVGGLMGILFSDSNGNGTVIDCYATGNVNGNTNVGGLMGKVQSGPNYEIINVSNCYSTGAVIGNNYAGGLIGLGGGNDNVTASFWDTQTSGQSTSLGGAGKTTIEMQTIKTFTDAGWNISLYNNYDNETWFIDNPEDYPRLSLEYDEYEPISTTIPGSSGGGINFWVQTEIIHDEEFEQGFFRELKTKERVKIKINGEDHYFGIVKLNSTTATVNITSNPIQLILDIGEEAKIDVLNNGFYNVYILLNNIIRANANLTIKSINEEISKVEDPVQNSEGTSNGEEGITEEPTQNSEGTSNGEEGITEEKNTFPYWVLGLVIVFLIIILLAMFFKRKSKR